MDHSRCHTPAKQVVAIPRCDRWQVYQRLQALEVPCWCSEDGQLQAEINSPLAALQLWSVVRQLTVPRRELVFWLHCCWQQET